MTVGALDPVQRLLACPKCHGRLAAVLDGYSCARCKGVFGIEHDVFLARAPGEGHYFDNRHQVMQEGNASKATWTIFYALQSRIATHLIRPTDIVVDIGCGPSVHYDKPAGAMVIGIDPSFASIRSNKDIDIRVFGGAEAMPLADGSVDRVFFFYSVHHMVGRSIAENAANVRAVLRECARVIRTGGNVVIFDVNPWWPAWTAQKLAWDWARSALDEKLDMFFWRDKPLIDFARDAFPGASLETRTFRAPALLRFPPVFVLPDLRIPRCLYPFDVMMYNWSIGNRIA